MARSLQFPVCLWKSSPDTVTARLVDDGYDEVVVTAGTRKEALSQIKDYLDRLSRTDSWMLFDPDFMDPEMRSLRFSVLPEYRSGVRSYPCPEQVQFRMPCVTGRRESGSPVALFPTLGIFFDYDREDSFSHLATHIATRELAGRAPAELSRMRPPEELWLEPLSVTLKGERTGHAPWEKQLAPLTEVADHLGGGGFRRIARTWEREREVDELARLIGPERASVCLVGEPGCGKSAVLIEAARRVERAARAGGHGKHRLMWMTSAGRLVAGMRWLGQWQARLEEVIERLGAIPGVLCVEDLAEMTRLGGESPATSLAAFLVPFLESGELRLVAEVTPAGLDACDRLVPGLIDRMRILKLEEFSGEQERRIVVRAADYFTRHDGVGYGPGAAQRTLDLFRRFQPYAAFPGKLTQFMGSLVDQVAVRESRGELTVADVEHHFSRTAGLPDFLVRGDGRLDFAAMRARFFEKLVAQDEAVDAVCRVIAKFAAGLNDPGRPVGVLLFCGPTGVGKTQLVRLVGDYLFPNRPERERLVRLDMSEYAGFDAASRLLGSRFGEPSEMIRRVRANPFSVLLLDEIEKASPEVFDVFLSLFDEGRLTDALGRVTSFQSTLIVMTSNLGAGGSGSIGFRPAGGDRESSSDRNAVTRFFRPEFFNRLDQVVWFGPLDRRAVESVARRELRDVAAREGLAERGITLEFEDRFEEVMARAGFDAAHGARPLQRAIEERLMLPLGRLLAERPELRDCAIRVRWETDRVVFDL